MQGESPQWILTPRAEVDDEIAHHKRQDGENDRQDKLTDDSRPEANRVIEPLEKNRTELLYPQRQTRIYMYCTRKEG